ncbi:hypothetical protein K402DRAFT_407695 [Aulographum hederae CBS 113979]|uniref:Gfd2/YDR514C-like C-terminal domain-containing protein n=1 Tax=Aulographum hederae CBS 113979 TaxID=1176131 RepID=A0A6G1GNL8_9PEZI|nr:hypothetical protein K402DRAFT_407695 [Aulographum hederae CBS 113979]
MANNNKNDKNDKKNPLLFPHAFERLAFYLGLHTPSVPRTEITSRPPVARIIAIDLEKFCYRENPVTAVGITWLDTSEIPIGYPGPHAANWLMHIHSHLFRPFQTGHMANNFAFFRDRPDEFDFGRAEWVPLWAVREILEELIDQAPTETVFLIHHGGREDRDLEQKLGYNLKHTPKNVMLLDTQSIALYRYLWRTLISIEKLCDLFGIEADKSHEGDKSKGDKSKGGKSHSAGTDDVWGVKFHNAGNDAVCTMVLTILMVIQWSELLADQYEREINDQLQDEHRRALLEAAARGGVALTGAPVSNYVHSADGGNYNTHLLRYALHYNRPEEWPPALTDVPLPARPIDFVIPRAKKEPDARKKSAAKKDGQAADKDKPAAIEEKPADYEGEPTAHDLMNALHNRPIPDLPTWGRFDYCTRCGSTTHTRPFCWEYVDCLKCHHIGHATGLCLMAPDLLPQKQWENDLRYGRFDQRARYREKLAADGKWKDPYQTGPGAPGRFRVDRDVYNPHGYAQVNEPPEDEKPEDKKPKEIRSPSAPPPRIPRQFKGGAISGARLAADARRNRQNPRPTGQAFVPPQRPGSEAGWHTTQHMNHYPNAHGAPMLIRNLHQANNQFSQQHGNNQFGNQGLGVQQHGNQYLTVPSTGPQMLAHQSGNQYYAAQHNPGGPQNYGGHQAFGNFQDVNPQGFFMGQQNLSWQDQLALREQLAEQGIIVGQGNFGVQQNFGGQGQFGAQQNFGHFQNPHQAFQAPQMAPQNWQFGHLGPAPAGNRNFQGAQWTQQPNVPHHQRGDFGGGHRNVQIDRPNSQMAPQNAMSARNVHGQIPLRAPQANAPSQNQAPVPMHPDGLTMANYNAFGRGRGRGGGRGNDSGRGRGRGGG